MDKLTAVGPDNCISIDGEGYYVDFPEDKKGLTVQWDHQKRLGFHSNGFHSESISGNDGVEYIKPYVALWEQGKELNSVHLAYDQLYYDAHSELIAHDQRVATEKRRQQLEDMLPIGEPSK